jgi:fructoselysine-6-P-deglycase FrlB-like protein
MKPDAPGWHTDDFPELRDGPPWVMQDMMLLQGEMADEMLAGAPEAAEAVAAAISQTLSDGLPVQVVGCGTSEHAAHGVAEILRRALPPQQRPLVRGRAALTAALEPVSGVCLGISHDGETRATALALQAAASAGAQTFAITNQPGGSVAGAADEVILTPRHDESWCHTVAYTSALLAGLAVATRLDMIGAEPAAARALFERALTSLDAAPTTRRLADRRVVLCAGAGLDHVSARELALKLAEGARMPTVALELETVLHGQLAAHEPADALILVAIFAHPQRVRTARRAELVAAAAAAIGLSVAAIVSGANDELIAPELTPAGRILVELPPPGELEPATAALLAGAAALQRLTLELAHARHKNPDLIRREQEPYRRAALVAEDAQDW